MGALPKEGIRASLEGSSISFDARGQGQPRPLPLGAKWGKNDRKRWNYLLAFCARATRTLGRCSLDARSGRPNRPPSCDGEVGNNEKTGMGSDHVPFLLAEQRKGCSLMIFCARATRGRGLPSLGLMARLGVPVGGRVRRLRAVEDQSAPIPGEKTSKLGGSIHLVRFAQ
jgi:hypothetical protein